MAKRQEVCVKIFEALDKLIQTQTLSDIKVTDLCRESGVHRSTFYTYFYDIYAVPQCIWDRLMQPTLYKIGDTKTWDEGHTLMFQNLLTRKTLFTKIYFENDYHSILEYGYRGGYDAVKKNVENRKKHVWTETELVELDYTIKALASLTTKWGRDGMQVPVDHIVQIFNDHVPQFLKELCDT